MLEGWLPSLALLLLAGTLLWTWRRRRNTVGSSLQTSEERKPGKMHVANLNPNDYQNQYVSAAQPHSLIDVRSPAEFREGHIPGAVNIDLESLTHRLQEIPRDRPAIFYCRSGRRSEMAANFAAQAGYADVANLGGIIAWQRQGLPVR